MKIELITKKSDLLKKGVSYIWKHWGSDSNFNFYKDCIENSISGTESLPKFYLMLDEDKIIGCYALLTNDIISRQDLMPWFAGAMPVWRISLSVNKPKLSSERRMLALLTSLEFISNPRSICPSSPLAGEPNICGITLGENSRPKCMPPA